jgi:CRP-like cAMP-binding protein
VGAPVELLKKVSLFESLDDDALRRIGERFRERLFEHGTHATDRESHGVGVFVIAEGKATVSSHAGDEIRTLGPGDFFGEVSAVDGARRSATVTADTHLRCYGITAAEFREIALEHPGVAWQLCRTLAAKLRQAEGRLAER